MTPAARARSTKSSPVWLVKSTTGQSVVAIAAAAVAMPSDRKSTRLNSSHSQISYAVFCLKKKKNTDHRHHRLSNQVDRTRTHPHRPFHYRAPIATCQHGRQANKRLSPAEPAPAVH